MNIKCSLISIGLLFAGIAVQAKNPQLVIDTGEDDSYVVNISALNRIEFKTDGINVLSHEEKFIPYSNFSRIVIDHEGTHKPSGIKSVTASSSSLKVVVAPSRNSISLLGLGEGETNVSVYSVSGATVLSLRSYTGGDIDVSNLPAGLYIVKTAGHSAKFIK